MNLRLRPQSVRRALRNLIDNAERYGGMVDASYGRENDHDTTASSQATASRCICHAKLLCITLLTTFTDALPPGTR